MAARLTPNVDINALNVTLFRYSFIILNFHSNFESHCINKFLLGVPMEIQLQARPVMTHSKTLQPILNFLRNS